MEQEEYEREQIDWSYIEFIGNQDILNLTEKLGCSMFYYMANFGMHLVIDHVT